jgi:hypothetical protein
MSYWLVEKLLRWLIFIFFYEVSA